MQVFAKVEPGAYTEEAINASLHAEDANNTLHDSTNGFHPPSHGHEMDGVAAPNGAETKGMKVQSKQPVSLHICTQQHTQPHGLPVCLHVMQVDGADPSLPSGFPGRGQDGNNPPSSNPPIDTGKKARFMSRGALTVKASRAASSSCHPCGERAMPALHRIPQLLSGRHLHVFTTILKIPSALHWWWCSSSRQICPSTGRPCDCSGGAPNGTSSDDKDDM